MEHLESQAVTVGLAGVPRLDGAQAPHRLPCQPHSLCIYGADEEACATGPDTDPHMFSFLSYGVGQYSGPVGLSLGSVLSLALRAGQRPQTELILEKDGALAPHRLVQAPY